MECFRMVIKARPEELGKIISGKGGHTGWYAKMKIPGEARWDFSIQPLKDGHLEVQQSFRYIPRGLLGLIYWYALYPLHQFVLRAMLKKIAKAAGSPVLWGTKRHVYERIDLCRHEFIASTKRF